MMIQLKLVYALTLALLLCAQPAGAQGVLETIREKIETIEGKLETILKKLETPSPKTETPPAAPACAAKFCVGDRVAIDLKAIEARVRVVPDGSEVPGSPIKAGEGGVALAFGAKLADGRTWTQVRFDLGVTGWVTDGPLCKKPCDAATVPPPPATPPALPPPVPPTTGGGPVSGATYYVAPSGDDANPGTVDRPFKTLQKSVPLLKPGETLIVRAGEYDTALGIDGGLIHNGNSIIPSGESWDKPVTIKAYPGERPVFRRYLPAGHPYSEAEVRDSIRLPTYEDCARYKNSNGVAFLVANFPYSCWQGSGTNQPAGGLYFQTPKGIVPGYVIDLLQSWTRVKFVIFDGVDIDAKGIVGNPIGFSDYTEHVRFQNLEIRYGVGSCISQATPPDKSHYDFDLVFVNVEIHSCGVPFDRNMVGGVLARKRAEARYWHGWYLHAGGARFIDSKSYNHAGTGLGPDGNNVVVRNSQIYDNSAQGIYITGGDNWVIEGNIFFNNGGAEIFHHGGRGHVIANNTIVASARNSFGIYINLAGQGALIRDNIIDGFRRPIYNTECGPSLPCFYTLPNTVTNNLVRSTEAGREITNANGATALIESANIKGVDPMLDENYRPKPGSPAIGKATHGGNIGAK